MARRVTSADRVMANCQPLSRRGSARLRVPTSVTGVRLTRGSKRSERQLSHNSRPAKLSRKSITPICRALKNHFAQVELELLQSIRTGDHAGGTPTLPRRSRKICTSYNAHWDYGSMFDVV